MAIFSTTALAEGFVIAVPSEKTNVGTVRLPPFTFSTISAVPGMVMAADVTDGDVATVEGATIKLSTMDGVTVNGAKVVAADVAASNGVIHAIDAVILPPGVNVAKLIKK